MIGKDRQHIGIMSVPEALRLAREAELDLVEISPQADPPVVQVMDFGKFLYEQHKKEREAKKAQKVIEVKERYRHVRVSSPALHMNYELIAAMELEQMIVARAGEWWEQYIVADTPPPPAMRSS